MAIKPTKYNVLIEVIKKDNKTSSGIIVPENNGDNIKRGIIVDVGDEVSLKNGDKVFYKKIESNKLEMDGKEYQIVDYREILAVVEG